MVPNHENKRDYYVNPCLSQLMDELWFQKLVEVKFFLWNQSINYFIPMRRMNLWCLIIKRKEIIMWIHIYLNWKMNFNFKNGGKRCFFYKTKALKSFIPKRRICLWCPILEWIEIIMWVHVCPSWWMNINSKKGRKEVFLMKPKNQYVLSQWGEYVYGAKSW